MAFCSVFIVVLFTLVINTVVSRGPIIFLKLVEGNEGEIDGVITPAASPGRIAFMASDTLNLTRITELYPG